MAMIKEKLLCSLLLTAIDDVQFDGVKLASRLIYVFISFINSKLGLDLVPRLGPIAVSPKQIGIVSLHNVHMTSDETAKNTSVSRLRGFPGGCMKLFLKASP